MHRLWRASRADNWLLRPDRNLLKVSLVEHQLQHPRVDGPLPTSGSLTTFQSLPSTNFQASVPLMIHGLDHQERATAIMLVHLKIRGRPRTDLFSLPQSSLQVLATEAPT